MCVWWGGGLTLGQCSIRGSAVHKTTPTANTNCKFGGLYDHLNSINSLAELAELTEVHYTHSYGLLQEKRAD